MTPQQVDAFWSKVAITARSTDCWPWTGAKKPKGYGNVRIDKKYLLSHRVAFEAANGPIPSGYIVCHVCDNPSCCNPSHLMLGTVSSNYCDMLIKGRRNFTKIRFTGESNKNAKLTDEKVLEIRRLYREKKMNQYELADVYGTTQTTIGKIVNNKTWRHI